MASVPTSEALLLAMILFALGLAGVLVRRNLVFLLISIEIMLNAAALAFVSGGSRWHQADGQILFILVITLAAAEVAVGLALILRIHQRIATLDADAATRLKG